MNIAIIGSGIAGLTCAWRLAGHHQVTLFEAGATPGGHTATVDVATPQGTWAIDTGFIVYNDRTYPRFMGLLSELGIGGQKTQMSFSVHNPASGLEYNGHSLTSLFAQRRNLLKPAFWGLLSEIVRFNRLAKLALTEALDPGATLESFLTRHRFSPFFARHYILPMGAAIWSSSLQEMRRFPLPLFLRFFENHGLLDIRDRPQWYVVPGGSREYVRALLARLGDRLDLRLNAPVQQVDRHPAGVILRLASGEAHFDQVIFACHSAQALAMLDVDPEGFDVMDRKLLEAVIHRFDGGPVGVDNIAASIGEDAGTIEDVIEPYLIQQGFLQRTPRGRMATVRAWNHFGITPPAMP